MTKRLMKRNAHACTTTAGFWLLFSFFSVWDWRDANRYIGDPNAVFNYCIWGFQIFFILCAVYFYRTEVPREVLCFGETEGAASIVVGQEDLPHLLGKLSGHIPELTQEKIIEIIALVQVAQIEDETIIDIPISFHRQPEVFSIVFEKLDVKTLNLFVSTHCDLLDEVRNVLCLYQKSE